MTRFASFNVENLFARPKAFNLATWEQGEPVLEAFAECNALMTETEYSAADKARMIELLLVLDVYRRREGAVHRNFSIEPRWAWLRANRGSFDVDRDEGIEIVAEGRGSWIGWLELATEPVEELTTRMTAKVIADVAADVLCVVEAEDRPSLDRFNQELLGSQYDLAMLIDGNDDRGIDVGLLTAPGVDITDMRSNVDRPDPGAAGQHLFSRDCPEYRCQLPGGAAVWVLCNHFKSQSGGGGDKRLRQSQGVRDIVDGLIAAGEPNVIVMGDLNEGPKQEGGQAANLAPLFAADGPLVSVYDLPGFQIGPRPGTFQSCSLRNRLDYILVSRALAPRVRGGYVERRGLWGSPTNKNPPKAWPVYPELTAARHGASDHAAVVVDVEI